MWAAQRKFKLLHLFSAVFLTFVLYLPSDGDQHVCGDYPFGNCFQKCYEICLTNVSTTAEDDEMKIEKIVMQHEACQEKCKTDTFVYSEKGQPDYDRDYKMCTGICKNPKSEHCKTEKGYLTKFFYCDCLACCDGELKPNPKHNYKPALCKKGCHIHFDKPADEDLNTTFCHFKPDYYNKTTGAWCTAWCSWHILKEKKYDANKIPDVLEKESAICKTRCSAFITGGQKIDYRTELMNKCKNEIEYIRCVSLAKVGKIVITTTITKAQADAAKKITLDFDKDRSHYGATNPTNNPQDFSGSYTGKHVALELATVTWPEALSNMELMGTHVDAKQKPDLELPDAATRDNRVPWADMGPLFSEAAKSIYQLEDKVNYPHGIIVQKKVESKIEASVKVAPCTSVAYGGKINLAQITDMKFDFYLNISDSKSMIPLTADKLKKGLDSDPFYTKGLQYVRNAGEFHVEYKGSGTFNAYFVVNAIFNTVKCNKYTTSPCKIPADWSAQTACKCTSGTAPTVCA